MKIISTIRRNDYENHAARVGHIYKNNSNSSDNNSKMRKWSQYPKPTKIYFVNVFILFQFHEDCLHIPDQKALLAK